MRFASGSTHKAEAMDGSEARFVALWKRCGGTGAESVYAELVRHYAEPGRHYHTLRHVHRCLGDLDWARGEIPAPDSVELALWCHDVIYVPGSRDNEQLSAEWFQRCAQDSIGVSERVVGMILATTHLIVPDDPDACFTVDIDLADLGSDRACFVRDEAQLRAERPDLDDLAYDQRERTFLSALLARPYLYHTEVFRTRCEARARMNLAWRLARPTPA
jgi:predicted metal-dependent HD superfamily phosphohydrolase